MHVLVLPLPRLHHQLTSTAFAAAAAKKGGERDLSPESLARNSRLSALVTDTHISMLLLLLGLILCSNGIEAYLLRDVVYEPGYKSVGDDGEQQSNMQLLSRVQKSSVSEVMGCKKLPPMQIFKQLNAVCEDCFQLFRDQEVYHMCRSECFSSDYFMGCMDYLIYAKDHITKMAGMVEDIHEYVR